jgi:hypothetical protein
MVETFTPAVCGSRRRQRLALAGFAVGAVAASALVGAALGAVGALLGTELAFLVAALALLAAAREAGIVRLSLPQLRRQVPERWRSDLPLPVWSVGYGIGLGLGFLTFQPVATFWVACAAAVALGKPLAAGLCFAAYGAGRALMTAWPRHGQADATAAVESLARRRRLLLLGNVLVLLVCAGLLAAAPAAGAAIQIQTVGAGLDPAAAWTVLGRARMDSGNSNVLLEPRGGAPFAAPGAAAPAVDGGLLAYQDGQGVKVIDWRTGDPVARVDGQVAKPALDWPLLAFVRTDSTYKRLVVVDFTNPASPTERVIVRIAAGNDLGRPSLAAGRIAWHKLTATSSTVYAQRLATGGRSVIARSSVLVLANPSITSTRIVWVRQSSRSCILRMRRWASPTVRTIYRTSGSTRLLWTTALTGRTAYVTRWSLRTGASTLVRVNF